MELPREVVLSALTAWKPTEAAPSAHSGLLRASPTREPQVGRHSCGECWGCFFQRGGEGGAPVSTNPGLPGCPSQPACLVNSASSGGVRSCNSALGQETGGPKGCPKGRGFPTHVLCLCSGPCSREARFSHSLMLALVETRPSSDPDPRHNLVLLSAVARSRQDSLDLWGRPFLTGLFWMVPETNRGLGTLFQYQLMLSLGLQHMCVHMCAHRLPGLGAGLHT